MKAMRAWPCFLAVALLPGCALQQAGKALGDGLMQAINDGSEQTARGLLKGAGDGLREDLLSQRNRRFLVDTALEVETAALSQLPAARDELLGERTREQMKLLVEVLLDSLEHRARRTSQGLLVDAGNGLREQILNAETEARLNALLVELSTTARGQTQQMRDDVLGEASQRQVKLLVDGAMGAVVDGTEKIRKQARDELSFVQRNTAEAMLVVGGIAAAVLLLIWRQKEKNRLLLHLLARQLHEMGDAPAYTAALDRLQKQAEQMGIRNQLEDAFLLEGWPGARRKGNRPGPPPGS